MAADPTPQKRALRAELRERRRILTRTQRAEAAEGLTARLVALTTSLGARRISCYLSTDDEPSTRPYVHWARAEGLTVLFPITRADGLLDWTTATDEEDPSTGSGRWETVGLFGMPEPVGELLGPIAINDADLILVPAAAVDARGMRLGWGRGYYDKTLGSMERCPPVYAVLFDTELVDEVPSERHDQAVDGVVTPARTIGFASRDRHDRRI